MTFNRIYIDEKGPWSGCEVKVFRGQINKGIIYISNTSGTCPEAARKNFVGQIAIVDQIISRNHVCFV